MENSIAKQMEMVLYRTEDDSVTVSAIIKDESIWITQKAMAELFGVQTPAISKHLKNIFEQGELKEDAIISVGYRGQAQEKAHLEYAIYNKNQPIESDFDKVVKRISQQ